VSTTVMSAVWPLMIPPVPKAVLVSLADNANDHGECWPSLTTICQRTCFKRTAVIEAIQWLEQHQLLAADRSNGRHTRYRVLVGNDLFAGMKPVRHADRSAKRTGSGERPDPSATRTGPVRHADTNRQEPSGTVIKASSRGTRLPDDWLPDEKLKAEARAQYPGVDLETATTEFRRFWLAEPDPRGRKLEWPLVWLNRMAQLAQSMRSKTPSSPPAAVRSKPPPDTPALRLRTHIEWLDEQLRLGRMAREEHETESRKAREKLERMEQAA
jgi:hypothetical protein